MLGTVCCQELEVAVVLPALILVEPEEAVHVAEEQCEAAPADERQVALQPEHGSILVDLAWVVHNQSLEAKLGMGNLLDTFADWAQRENRSRVAIAHQTDKC